MSETPETKMMMDVKVDEGSICTSVIFNPAAFIVYVPSNSPTRTPVTLTDGSAGIRLGQLVLLLVKWSRSFLTNADENMIKKLIAAKGPRERAGGLDFKIEAERGYPFLGVWIYRPLVNPIW